MLARTIDKLRATLPGGNLGAYQMAGFSVRLMTELGVGEDDFRANVAAAATDDVVVAWLHQHSNPADYERINAKLSAPTVGDRLDRPEFAAKYPIVSKLPPETRLLDMLDIDDREMFPKTSPS
jgi:hypothetical protein